MAKNKIITTQGNVQFINSKGKTIDMHPMHCYAVYENDTVSFLFIYMKEYSGQAFFASQFEDLEVNGTIYDNMDDLKDAINYAFAKAGAQARTEIVDELPEDPFTNTIYLLPKEHGEGYDEYIWNEDEGWQLIGDTDIEFDRYLQITDFNDYSAATADKISTLSGAIDTNASGITFISGAVDTEISARTASDAFISGAVDTVSSALTSESQRAISAETALQNNIDTANGRIDSEQLARANADNYISGVVNTISGTVNSLSSSKADKVDAVASAEYVESSTTINFKNISGEVISSIDASDFVIDGMIDDVRIETISGASYLVIDFNTASGKEDIQIPLTDIFNPDNYYDKSAIDGIVSGLTSRMTEDEEVTAAGLNAINDSLSGKVDTSAFTAHASDTIIHVTSAQTASWDAKSDFSGSYNDLTDKPTIPTVPTSNTAFTNDAGYITEDAISGKADSSAVTESISGLTERIAEDEEVTAAGLNALNDALSGYAQTSAVTAEITSAISGKADTSAVTEAISAATSGLATPYSAGSGITISSGNVISLGVPVYKGSGNSSVSITTETGTTQGSNKLGGNFTTGIGYGLNTKNSGELAVGTYNSSISASTVFGNSGNTLFSVGNGSSDGQRHNAFEIRQNGDIYITSGGTTTGIPMLLQDNLGKPSTSAVTSGSTDVITSGGVYEQLGGLKLVKLTQADYDALSGNTDANTLYVIVNPPSWHIIPSGSTISTLKGSKIRVSSSVLANESDNVAFGTTSDNVYALAYIPGMGGWFNWQTWTSGSSTPFSVNQITQVDGYYEIDFGEELNGFGSYTDSSATTTTDVTPFEFEIYY